MTGDKPDERLRTPMQWKPGHGTGFTSGTPWEAAQPDSMTTTVEAQNADSASLLNLYRRLIHLRKSNEALRDGRLLSLTSGTPSIAAYLRRAGDHAVLVVANMTGEPVSEVSLGSEAEALPPGGYELRNLLGGPSGAALDVGSEGRLERYTPLSGGLGPRQVLVLELVRR